MCKYVAVDSIVYAYGRSVVVVELYYVILHAQQTL